MTARHAIGLAWLVLGGIWAVGAFTTKHTARRQSKTSMIWHVLALVAACSLLVGNAFAFQPFDDRVAPAMPWSGLVLVVAGVAFAIWARFYLGGNWSGDVTVKQDHTLVRSGPYGVVRHPIYSGLLLAILGTALSTGQLRGFLALVISFWGWKHKSLIEEGFMVEQFGTQYEAYRRGVKCLVPWIW
jgi:protein-S-isoprenylcysteine O-methyltransferase Ste14